MSWRALRTLNLRLHIIDGVGRLHLEGDRLTREGFHENLHSDLNNPVCGLSLQPSWQLCVVRERKPSAAKLTMVEMLKWAAKARTWTLYFSVDYVALSWRALRQIEPVRCDHDNHWLFPICVAVAKSPINNRRLLLVVIRPSLHDFQPS
jgi:hypothetical protein